MKEGCRKKKGRTFWGDRGREQELLFSVRDTKIITRTARRRAFLETN